MSWTETPDQAAAAKHYSDAERFAQEADTWMDADWGWKGQLSTEERLAYRANDLAAAQVHATLAVVLMLRGRVA